ncbi:TauD/TfdA family dioxygenase [Kitasatospora sp. NPDC048296]|uniref:TauD/TfdA family dioxygenase n=1 Tax=Kitasatospora sp. NPDC048296 TaxID=3364048 RepID=UPI003717765A
MNTLVDSKSSWDPLNAVDRTAMAAELLPLRLRQFLASARTEESDVITVSGLPLSTDMSPTPAGWRVAADTRAGYWEEALLMLVACGLADPFAWADQQNGRILHDVCPTLGEENSLTSASSAANLSLHTEDVFHPCRADYVALLCLRNPDAAGTTIVRASELDLPHRDRLFGDHFRFFPDDSHTEGGDAEAAARKAQVGSVLFGSNDLPYFRFDLDFIAPADTADTQTRAAITDVQTHLEKAVERVVLEPGDLVFLDNYQVVHGREPFRARFDGTDRWLKRVNLIRDVRRIFAHTGQRSRVIA